MLGKRGKKSRLGVVLVIVLVLIAFAINSSTSVLKVAYPLKYKEYVYKYSAQYKVDPYLVFSIIKAESGFDPKATSHKKARGLMQISEVTANWGAKTLKIEKFSYDKLYDPETNISIGCWYINNLMREFGDNTQVVLAAYNGGSGNVSEWLKDTRYSKSGSTLDKIPFKETENYVKKVQNYYSVYKKIYTKEE